MDHLSLAGSNSDFSTLPPQRRDTFCKQSMLPDSILDPFSVVKAAKRKNSPMKTKNKNNNNQGSGEILLHVQKAHFPDFLFYYS